MRTAILTIKDEAGNIVSERSYPLDSNLANLTKIEQNVENLRGELLCDLTSDLLSLEQSAHEKKKLFPD
jgi:hypothetical protein